MAVDDVRKGRMDSDDSSGREPVEPRPEELQHVREVEKRDDAILAGELTPSAAGMRRVAERLRADGRVEEADRREQKAAEHMKKIQERIKRSREKKPRG